MPGPKRAEATAAKKKAEKKEAEMRIDAMPNAGRYKLVDGKLVPDKGGDIWVIPMHPDTNISAPPPAKIAGGKRYTVSLAYEVKDE